MLMRRAARRPELQSAPLALIATQPPLALIATQPPLTLIAKFTLENTQRLLALIATSGMN